MLVPDFVWISLAVAVSLYATFVVVLLVAGRRSDARALAGFIPDCVVFFRRLLADERVPRNRKFALVLLVGYLAMPFDLVPDFIPVAGQLDDAILAALVLRFVIRSAGPALIAEHWPGPPQGAGLITRIAFGAQTRGGPRAPQG
jgi:uncharacterized membrane protein YkvA (DUF1232 family)